MQESNKIVRNQYFAMIAALIISVTFGVLLSLGRAYQTQDMHALLRLGLWVTVCALISFQVLLIEAKARAWLRRTRFRRMRSSKQGLINVLSKVIALLITNLVLAIELDLLKYTPLLPKQHDPYLEFVIFLTPPVMLIGLVALFAADFLAKISFSGVASDTKVDAEMEPSSLSKTQSCESWPAPSSIIYVQAQEHYLNIQTAQGRHFVRARIKDAADYLVKENGLQVHRSWWVAKPSVDRVIKTKRDYSLCLKGGQVIPVGRSRVKKLKESGWL